MASLMQQEFVQVSQAKDYHQRYRHHSLKATVCTLSTKRDNVAILVLYNKFNRTNYVQPACLGFRTFKEGNIRANQNAVCYAVGFNAEDKESKWEKSLRYVGLRRGDQENRKNATSQYRQGDIVWTGGSKVDPKTCYGERGSPAYCMGSCDGESR